MPQVLARIAAVKERRLQHPQEICEQIKADAERECQENDMKVAYPDADNLLFVPHQQVHELRRGGSYNGHHRSRKYHYNLKTVP